jgi:hypothetical protein
MLLTRTGKFKVQHSLSTDSRTVNEKKAYQLFCAELVKADVVYGHNIRRHDLPILNAGLLRRQLPILPPLLTTDTLQGLSRREAACLPLWRTWRPTTTSRERSWG